LESDSLVKVSQIRISGHRQFDKQDRGARKPLGASHRVLKHLNHYRLEYPFGLGEVTGSQGHPSVACSIAVPSLVIFAELLGS